MLALLLLLTACSPTDDTDDVTEGTDAEPVALRVATFNVAMFSTQPGRIASTLERGEYEAAQILATILQDVRPDVVLLNEVDWDADGRAVGSLLDDYIGVSQDGMDPLDYPHVYVPTVNTGVASGVDLDGNGTAVTTPGASGYGNDAFGFGTYEGQYGMVLLSRFPIDTDGVRTFQTLLWADMPGALLPTDPDGSPWYSAEALEVLRLSSKTHADVPIVVGDTTVHALISHPTPPGFDGDEDRNGQRNHDEVRFWVDYIGTSDWMTDDDGVTGGLGDEPFVVMGDLNRDPIDGDAPGTAMTDLLTAPRVASFDAPTSAGAAEQSELQRGINTSHQGPAEQDTTDFEDSEVGNLRLDYVLPSADLTVTGSGVFWPTTDDPDFDLVGTFPFPLSDHRLVWVDVVVE